MEFSDSIRRGLAARGYRVSTVVVRSRRTREQAIAALAQTKATRLVLLTVNEWATDTYNSTDLSYDLDLEVLDSSGQVLARSTDKGEDHLGMSLFNPQAEAKKSAPEALQSKLGALINDAKVAEALKAPASPATAPEQSEEATE